MTPVKYLLYDLKSLTFQTIGSEQEEVDVWHATPEQFHAFVSQFASGFGKVNINIWPLAERLAFVNTAWTHFESVGHPFPFRQRQHLVPDVDAADVPHVDGNSDNTVSQAV